MTDLELLVRDKYDGDASLLTDEDTERLAAGEPLAYVIGWIPFLGLRIGLDSKPLIPRPETEWWTEKLIAHLYEHFGTNEGLNDQAFRFLDLCAGSGAIGLSILKSFPNAEVWFGELMPEHCEQIRKNIVLNNLDASRAHVQESDIFAAFGSQKWDVIATNPPYIPSARPLDASVIDFEPSEALFAGSDGLDVIRRIAIEIKEHMETWGELWMECDVENIEEAKRLLIHGGAAGATLHNDLYNRPRLVVASY